MKIEIEVDALPGQPVFYIEGNEVRRGVLHILNIDIRPGTYSAAFVLKRKCRFQFWIGYMSLRGWREKRVSKISLTREGLLKQL
jgi:hypothetical protein